MNISGASTSALTINGGNPQIYLESSNLSTANGNAVNITNGDPTIHVVGTNSISNASDNENRGGAGIFVTEGNSVTIKSTDKNTNSLTVTGYYGAGIGSVASNVTGTGTSCGDISIENVTVIATATAIYGYPPGIGSCGAASCGTITITNAIVHARGKSTVNCAAAAIGTGLDEMMNSGTIPTIQITDSDIHAHKGTYSDYIGSSGNQLLKKKYIFQATDLTCILLFNFGNIF